MDLNFTPEEDAFRAEVRAFLADKLPARLAEKVRTGRHLSKADMEAWHAILNERGWLANHWPKQYGGPGWNAVQKFIFENECALAHAPRIVPFGVNMLGPVLIKYGSEAQKQRWLPRILDGSDWWCQGYSEPGAGSDLASVKTTAVRGSDAQGDHYIVNGQKTWTTLGQHANMIFCLVRTNKEAKAQSGISFLLVDMKSPGVEVRPIITLDGEHEVNEVFFTDVRVPAENLVGEENKGWTCAKYLLTHERTSVANVGNLKRNLRRLRREAGKVKVGDGVLLEQPTFARRVAEIEVQITALEFTQLRILSQVARGGAPGAESSLLKVRGTEIQQALTELLLEAAGYEGFAFVPEGGQALGPKFAARAAANYFNFRKVTIYGGSSEIQKNIMTKAVLGI